MQVITSLSTGGAEVMLRNVLAHLDHRKFDLMVVSLSTRSPIGEEIAALGIPVIAIGGSGGVLTPRQIVRIRKLVAVWRPDVMHAWMYHANLAAFALSLSRPRPALITSIRGSLDAPDQQKPSLRVIRRLDALASRWADAIVFNSSVSARQHIALGYDPRRVQVIPNGFDIVRFAPSQGSRAAMREALGCAGEPLVGLIGRFDPLKGHRVFLEAAALVAARQPECRFVLAGRGCDDSNEMLGRWIAEFGLRERVALLGERRDIAELDCALDIVVCSSLSESFPNAIGEAMSCGVPAVVTRVGDCAELVGDTGVVVPARDATALAGGVLNLLELDAAERAALGRRARERIVERYALVSVAARFAMLYESSHGRRQGKPA